MAIRTMTFGEASALYMSKRDTPLMREVFASFRGFGAGKKHIWTYIDKHYVPLHSKALLFQFRDVHMETADVKGMSEVARVVWERTLEAMDTPRESVVAGQPSKTLRQVFVERFVDHSPSSDPREVSSYLEAYIASQQRGILFERIAYERLREAFGADAVEWADHDDEDEDVDLYLFGLPVSVKGASGFTEKTFDKCRHKGKWENGVQLKKEKPVLYISDQIQFVVPDPSAGVKFSKPYGKRKWDTASSRSPRLYVDENIGELREFLNRNDAALRRRYEKWLASHGKTAYGKAA